MLRIKYNSYSKIVLYFSIFIIVSVSCKKLVEVEPPYTQMSEEDVYTDDSKAISALTGIYGSMSNNSYFSGSGSTGSIGLMTGLSSDELTLHGGVTDLRYRAYYTNSLMSDGVTEYGSEFWGGSSGLYNYIYKCNSAINGIEASQSLTQSIKKQLLGESKFLRAFFYFYLVNMFGDVPLVLDVDYKYNLLMSRASKVDVYSQIIQDLLEAKELLSDNFLNATVLEGTSERIRPTKWAASALLSRIYLYQENWQSAESEATKVINSSLFSIVPLNDVFRKNSKEAIWQLQPVNQYFNTKEAITYIIPSTGPTNTTANPVYLSSQLLNSFEANDLRKVNGNWLNVRKVGAVTYTYPYKYKLNTRNTNIVSPAQMEEYFMVLRLGEQYLIRAEARAQQNNISGAKSDLDSIRIRAGLSATSTNGKDALLAVILHEKQVELFTEWGHRWFDLKRTQGINSVMAIVTPQKSQGAVFWQPYQALFPIPFDDIQRAPNEILQNFGY